MCHHLVWTRAPSRGHSVWALWQGAAQSKMVPRFVVRFRGHAEAFLRKKALPRCANHLFFRHVCDMSKDVHWLIRVFQLARVLGQSGRLQWICWLRWLLVLCRFRIGGCLGRLWDVAGATEFARMTRERAAPPCCGVGRCCCCCHCCRCCP